MKKKIQKNPKQRLVITNNGQTKNEGMFVKTLKRAKEIVGSRDNLTIDRKPVIKHAYFFDKTGNRAVISTRI